MGKQNGMAQYEQLLRAMDERKLTWTVLRYAHRLLRTI